MTIHVKHLAAEDTSLSPKTLGLWRLLDPKIALASFIPFLLGAAISHHAGAYVAPDLFLLALVALFAVEVGKNAVNDLYDFRSGADTGVLDEERTPFSGGKRVIVEGLLTEAETSHVGWSAFIVAAAAGGLAALLSRPELLLLGAAGAFVAYAYTAAPLKLCYRGLGEIAVFLAYGPGIVLGTTYLFLGRVEAGAMYASLVMGALVANVLLVNELPDERPDREAGKRTLVVRLGREGAVRLVAALFVLAFAVAVLGIGTTPRLVAAWIGIPFAAASLSLLGLAGKGPIPVKAQVSTLLAFAVSGLSLAVAFIV